MGTAFFYSCDLKALVIEAEIKKRALHLSGAIRSHTYGDLMMHDTSSFILGKTDFPARVMSLFEGQALCPELSNLRNLLASYGASSTHGLAIADETRLLPGLGLEKIAPYFVALSLPDVFADVLPKLAQAPGEVCNLVSEDLSANSTVMSWQVCGQAWVSVGIDAFAWVVERCEPSIEVDGAAGVGQADILVPVLMLAADSVAITVTRMESFWRDSCGAAAMGAGANWRPERYYDDELLKRAKEDAFACAPEPEPGAATDVDGCVSAHLPMGLPVARDIAR